jgi:hypothetical protein
MVNMANDIREALSRIIRVESQIASVSLGNSTVTQDILYKVSVLQSEVHTVQNQVNSYCTRHLSPFLLHTSQFTLHTSHR